MRILLTSLLLMLCLAAPLRAAEPASGPSPPDDGPPLKLGENVVLPRSVYAQILAREDGLATIERIQARASDAERFKGVPHVAIVFAGVLLFFWSSMFYYQRKQERLLVTIQLFVEKGLSVPPELLRAVEGAESDDEKGSLATAPQSAPPAWASNLMWGGLLWVTIGVCGTLYLWLRGNDAWPWGFAAIVYGMASMITAYGKTKTKS
jgi:hypothetical protein